MGRQPKARKKEPNALRRAYRRARGRLKLAVTKKDATYGHKWPYRYKTASQHNAALFGKEFIETFPKTELRGKKRKKFVVSICKAFFESSYSVGLRAKATGSGKEISEFAFANAKLGFQKNTLIVEALNATKGKQPELERFREMHGKPWANYLLEKAEEHARKCGFKKVKIRTPESLYYYHYANLGKGKKQDKEKQKREIQERMEALYSKVAKAMGYKRRGAFFVKRL